MPKSSSECSKGPIQNRKWNLPRSALNYDLLAATFLTLRSLSPNLTWHDFVNLAVLRTTGSKEALTHLHAHDGNSATTSLTTASPCLTEIRLPDNLPELSSALSGSRTDLAISFRMGLLVAAPSTAPGLWVPMSCVVVPLSRSSLRKVRRTLLQQIKQEHKQSASTEVPYLPARSDYSIG